MNDRYDNERWLTDLRKAAQEFRDVMVTSGAVHKVSQDAYFEQYRALGCALEPLNYLRNTDSATGER